MVFIVETIEVAKVSKIRLEREEITSRDKNLPKILSYVINTARPNTSKKLRLRLS